MPEDLYLPCLWFEAKAEASPESAELLNTLLKIPDLVNIIGTLIVILSLIGVIVSVVLRCKKKAKSFKDDLSPTVEDLTKIKDSPDVLKLLLDNSKETPIIKN